MVILKTPQTIQTSNFTVIDAQTVQIKKVTSIQDMIALKNKMASFKKALRIGSKILVENTTTDVPIDHQWLFSIDFYHFFPSLNLFFLTFTLPIFTNYGSGSQSTTNLFFIRSLRITEKLSPQCENTRKPTADLPIQELQKCHFKPTDNPRKVRKPQMLSSNHKDKLQAKFPIQLIQKSCERRCLASLWRDILNY